MSSIQWPSLPSIAGSVTSVALTAPASILTVSGSPIVTNGTLGLNLLPQNSNLIWAGPISGGASTPTFRALVTGDLPNFSSLTASQSLALDGSKNLISVPPSSVVGAPQTIDGTLTSPIYAIPTNAPTLSFTPGVSGTFRISGTICYSNTSNTTVGAKIEATAGVPGIAFNAESIQDTISTFGIQQSLYVYGIFILTGGVPYSFSLEMKSAAGTIALKNSSPTNGIALIAERLY